MMVPLLLWTFLIFILLLFSCSLDQIIIDLLRFKCIEPFKFFHSFFKNSIMFNSFRKFCISVIALLSYRISFDSLYYFYVFIDILHVMIHTILSVLRAWLSLVLWMYGQSTIPNFCLISPTGGFPQENFLLKVPFII